MSTELDERIFTRKVWCLNVVLFWREGLNEYCEYVADWLFAVWTDILGLN